MRNISGLVSIGRSWDVVKPSRVAVHRLPGLWDRALRGPRQRHYRQTARQMCTLLFGRNDDGGALVEFALTLPLILLLMTGIFTFSIALWQKITLSEAMSVGGRLLAVDRGDTDPCKTATTSIYGAAPGLSQTNLTLTFTLNGVNYGSGVTTCPGPSGAKNANMVQGQTVMIQASYPLSLAVYGTQYSGMSLGSQITEVIQ